MRSLNPTDEVAHPVSEVVLPPVFLG